MGLGLDQPTHWLLIAVLAMLLFGYKKMPDMARSAGRSLRIFKTEIKGMSEDDDARSAEHAASAAPAAIAPVPAPAPTVVTPVVPVTTHTATTHAAPPPAG